MPNILEEADNFKWKQTGEKIASSAKEVQVDIIDLKFFEVLRFFDITTAEQMRDKEAMRKIKTIYEFLKGEEDILSAARELDSKLGNTLDLAEKLNKMYAYIYSINLEKKFGEEKEIASREAEEKLKKGREEKLELEKSKAKEERQEKLQQLLKQQQIEKEKRKEAYLKAKKEKEIKEAMEKIKKTKEPEPSSLPRVEI